MEWLGELRVPVISASMAGAAGHRLAAAVTAAGGLGTVGFTGAATAESVTAELEPLRGTAFGVGLMNWTLADRPGVLDAAVAAGPVLVSISFGDPAPWVDRARAGGATVVTQVGTLDEARRALDAGVDLLVARGSEGGGHGRGEVATLPLLQQVLDLADPAGVPVAAAGGIGTARGLAAVIAAGAVAAWVGTPFAATVESAMADPLKAAIVAADCADTVYTRVFDITQRFAWPAVYGGRALVNPFTAEWAGRVDDLEQAVAIDPSMTERMTAARAEADLTWAPVYAGQSVGLVDRLRTADEVVESFAAYHDLLREALGRAGGA